MNEDITFQIYTISRGHLKLGYMALKNKYAYKIICHRNVYVKRKRQQHLILSDNFSSYHILAKLLQ
jgi:hypothetical protein